MSSPDVNAKIQDYQQLRAELAQLIDNRQTMVTQVNETGMVKQELDVIEPGAAVYKLIGPVLIPQSHEDAVQNVDTRLTYIKAELEKVDKLIEEKEGQIQSLQEEIMTAQREMAMKAKEEAEAVAQEAIAA